MGIPTTREPPWKFFLARLFGERVLACDHVADKEICMIEGAMWRGRMYILKYTMVEIPNDRIYRGY